MSRLSGRRVLIIGASSGIGHATAEVLAREGAKLAIAARRSDRLEARAESLPDGAAKIPLDVRDGAACDRAIARAAEALDGIDDLVYCAGIATLSVLEDADAELWREAIETNVIGASLVTRAALPYLRASAGRAIYLSSVAADEHPPRRGLALYASSKHALNRLIECWREEERSISFTRVSVGDTHATEMASDWGEAAGSFIGEWVEKGYLFGRTMTPEVVAHHIADLLASREAVPVSTIVPRYPQP
jgi:NAD(P)-dependent dehydrogenase (short-subunit alcohol dehydrogenase family)